VVARASALTRRRTVSSSGPVTISGQQPRASHICAVSHRRAENSGCSAIGPPPFSKLKRSLVSRLDSTAPAMCAALDQQSRKLAYQGAARTWYGRCERADQDAGPMAGTAALRPRQISAQIRSDMEVPIHGGCGSRP
jgi:hypothetical protein